MVDIRGSRNALGTNANVSYARGKVLSVDYRKRVAEVQLATNRVLVSIDLTRGKSSVPAVGELWILDQAYDQWMFAVPVGVAAVPALNHTFEVPGTQSVAVGGRRWYNDSGRALTVVTVRLSLGTPTGGAILICDLNLDGTTLYPDPATRPALPVGQSSILATLPPVPVIPALSYLTLDVDQIGTSPAGADLTCTVWLA